MDNRKERFIDLGLRGTTYSGQSWCSSAPLSVFELNRAFKIATRVFHNAVTDAKLVDGRSSDEEFKLELDLCCLESDVWCLGS